MTGYKKNYQFKPAKVVSKLKTIEDYTLHLLQKRLSWQQDIYMSCQDQNALFIVDISFKKKNNHKTKTS
jgi:hypothetical protein